MNNTSIKFYTLTNDETGKIVLTPAGEIPNKPARSRELVAEIDRLKELLREITDLVLTDWRLDEFDDLAIRIRAEIGEEDA